MQPKEKPKEMDPEDRIEDEGDKDIFEEPNEEEEEDTTQEDATMDTTSMCVMGSMLEKFMEKMYTMNERERKIERDR